MFLSRYIDYLTFERRYSPHTVSGYRSEVDKLHVYLDQIQIPLEQVRHAHLRAYFAQAMQAGAQASSVNRSISAVKSYFSFLRRSKMLSSDPSRDLKTLKQPKRLPTVVNPVHLSDLLDFDVVFPANFSGSRDKLVIDFLFGTGMRLSELLGIKLVDIDLYNKQVRVLGKRNKVRILPMHETLCQSLRAYLSAREAMGYEQETLILTDKGTAAYEKLIYRIVYKYLSLCSTQKKRSPHVLRHTFATAMLEKGADLNAIKTLLGHASLAATQVYTHNTAERLKSIYEQAHPRA